jgi:hypothetical protein
MNQDPTSTLDRLLALAAEAEQILAQTVASEEVRDAFAIVRGYLDLGRIYGEPVKVDDLERLLARIASSIGDAKFRRRFLLRLRTVAAWARLAPTEAEAGLQGAVCQV